MHINPKTLKDYINVFNNKIRCHFQYKSPDYSRKQHLKFCQSHWNQVSFPSKRERRQNKKGTKEKYLYLEYYFFKKNKLTPNSLCRL